MRILQSALAACLLTLAISTPPAVAQARTLCDLPKAKVLADLTVRLEDRYPTNEGIRHAQYNAAADDFDVLCSIPLTPRSRELLADLTTRHYPSVTLIRSFFESLNGQQAAN